MNYGQDNSNFFVSTLFFSCDAISYMLLFFFWGDIFFSDNNVQLYKEVPYDIEIQSRINNTVKTRTHPADRILFAHIPEIRTLIFKPKIFVRQN